MDSTKKEHSSLVEAEAHYYKATETLDVERNDESAHLIIAIKGAMKIQIDKQIWSLSSNRFILVQKDTAYQIRVEARTTLCILKIHPKKYFPNENSKIIEVTPLLKEIILQCARQKTLSEEINRDRHLFELLKDHLKEQSQNSMSIPLPQDERALKIYHLIVHKKQFDQSFESLALKVGASKRTLERIFQSEIGMTFSKWRQLLRLQHSLTLLDKGISIADISGEVGYGSSSAFIHAFKEYFGHPPGQYLNTKK